MDTVAAKPLPVLFACSCGSSAGRLANHVATTLDERGDAEMAAIAAVGGKRPDVLSKATWRFPVVVIDGCPKVCARYCLAQQGLQPTLHVVLSDLGIAQRERADFSAAEAREALAGVRRQLG
jgi:uncharacterized metal-binding protein